MMTTSPTPIQNRQERASWRIRHGTAAVEFAIALPILMLLAVGSTDFGRIVYFHQVVANAARTGAETGATHQFTAFTRSSWGSEIKDAVLVELQNLPQFNSSKMTYSLTTTINADGLAKIVVNVSYPFQTLIAWPGFSAPVQLHKQVEVLQFR